MSSDENNYEPFVKKRRKYKLWKDDPNILVIAHIILVLYNRQFMGFPFKNTNRHKYSVFVRYSRITRIE